MARGMLGSTRLIRFARILLDMALGMALEIAPGVGMGRDMGECREDYPYPATYPNSSGEVRFLSQFGYT